MSWRTRQKLRQYLFDSIWVIPAVFGVLALVAGVGLPQLDEHIDTTIGLSFGADAGRAVLGAIAGGMITFTGFVFSILLLAVQFGSSQFSPRLLGWFLRAGTTKVALGMFGATFIYSLLVLRTVGTAENTDFVPSNSISIAVLLLLASMVMFLRLIQSTTQGLRVASVVTRLGRQARKVIRETYPDLLAADAPPDDPPPGEPAAVVHFHGEPGIVRGIDTDGLVAMAREADAQIELVPPIGDFVAPGVPLFRVYGSRDLDAERLRASVAIGDERSLDQDPAFAFRLLGDISSKALSPGINDPSTAIQALDQIEVLLRELAPRRLTPGIARDQDGRVRLRHPAPSWEDYLSLALDETRHFGEGSVQVARRMRALIEDLLEAVPEARRAPLEVELVLLDASVGRGFDDDLDRQSAGVGDRQGIGSPVTVGDSVVTRGR